MPIVAKIWNVDFIPADLYNDYELWHTSNIVLRDCRQGASLVADYIRERLRSSDAEVTLLLTKRNIAGMARKMVQLGVAVQVNGSNLDDKLRSMSSEILEFIARIRVRSSDGTQVETPGLVASPSCALASDALQIDTDLIDRLQGRYAAARVTRPLRIEVPNVSTTTANETDNIAENISTVLVTHHLAVACDTPAEQVLEQTTCLVTNANFHKRLVGLFSRDGRKLASVSVPDDVLMRTLVEHGLSKTELQVQIRTVTEPGKRPRRELINQRM